jgi:hypothetical protein
LLLGRIDVNLDGVEKVERGRHSHGMSASAK